MAWYLSSPAWRKREFHGRRTPPISAAAKVDVDADGRELALPGRLRPCPAATDSPAKVAMAFSRLARIAAKIIILSQFPADSCLTVAAKVRMDVENLRVIQRIS
jgi:hypothetical protein